MHKLLIVLFPRQLILHTTPTYYVAQSHCLSEQKGNHLTELTELT
jgi:hypothetical protein